MSKMKNILGMYGMFAAIGMMGDGALGNYREIDEPKETPAQRKKRLERAAVKINKANGLKEFCYGDNKLWTLNQKNADKKAKKLNWL